MRISKKNTKSSNADFWVTLNAALLHLCRIIMNGLYNEQWTIIYNNNYNEQPDEVPFDQAKYRDYRIYIIIIAVSVKISSTCKKILEYI